MKSLLLLVLYLFCMTVTFSQPVDSIYVSKQKEISNFLDLIFINFSDRTTTSLNLDYRSFPTTYTTYAIFGTQVKLIDSPTPNASVLREFEFGDSVWLPNYRDTSITHRTESHRLAAIYEFKEMAYYYCYFAVTSNGDYGFILQDDLVMQNITEKIDNGKYILYREWRKVGLVSSDFSKSIVLPSNDVQFSSEHESLIYSIDNYMEPLMGTKN